jgi:thiamine-monophosphate kinase
MGFVLAGGDDHALAAAFPEGTDLPDAWSVVGRVTEAAGETGQVLVDGEVPEGDLGYRHF